MRLPQPSLLALHLAMGVPLIALAVWFGAIDQLPVGEDRCASCGVEGYVIAAHVVAAVWLGAVVAATAAARSLALAPAGAIWWALAAIAHWRRPAPSEASLRARATGELVAAWVSLAVLLPAIFGWVWADRVAWLVF